MSPDLTDMWRGSEEEVEWPMFRRPVVPLTQITLLDIICFSSGLLFFSCLYFLFVSGRRPSLSLPPSQYDHTQKRPARRGCHSKGVLLCSRPALYAFVSKPKI